MSLHVKVAGAWQEIGAGAGGGVPWAKVSGGTVTEVTNGDGSVDSIHTFTSTGSIIVEEPGVARVLVLGGGGAEGLNGSGYSGGGGGQCVDVMAYLPLGPVAVTVGAARAATGNTANGVDGNHSEIASVPPIKCWGGGGGTNSTIWPGPRGGGFNQGGAGAAGAGGASVRGAGLTSDITGTAVEYGRGGGAAGAGNESTSKAGRVIVRVRKSDPLPLPVTQDGWAKVSGGTVTTYAKPDGSVMEVHTYTANGTLTVDSPGFAQVLLVGGGSNGNGISGQAAGAGGGAWEGYLPLPGGALPVAIGASAAWNANAGATSMGAWSVGGAINNNPSVPKRGGGGLAITAGGFAGGGAVGDGDANTGGVGLNSGISGTTVMYGKGGNKTGTTSAPANTGGGGDGGGNGAAGVVIVAVQKSAPTVSGVVASGGTVTNYTGDGTNGVLGQKYRVHTFTANGTLTVTQGGEVDVLLVGGGGAGGAGNGGGGGGGGAAIYRPVCLPAGSHPVKIGAGGTYPRGNGALTLAFDITAPGGGGGGTADDATLNPAQPSGFGASSGGGASVGAGVPGAVGPGGGQYGSVYGSSGGVGATDSASWRSGGGGGGAGGGGGNGAQNSGGVGGPGVSNSITGAAVTYGAGGRGGPNGAAPAANSGAGGGGANTGTAGAAGIVIVRYKVA